MVVVANGRMPLADRARHYRRTVKTASGLQSHYALGWIDGHDELGMEHPFEKECPFKLQPPFA